MNLDQAKTIRLIRDVQHYMMDRRVEPQDWAEANDLAECWRLVGRLDALIILMGGEVETE